LEKFEMKKTLVAVAAMAAITGAMAEVTISGQVDLSVNATTTTLAAGTKSTVNSVGSNQFGQSQITFGVTEDMGDGTSAYANMVFIPSPASNGTSLNQDTGSGVGIKGAFGNLFLGNVYSQVWTVYAAADASGFGATSTAGSVWANTNGVGAKSQSIVYTLPSMIQGLDITVEQNYAGSTTGNGDAQGLGITYTSGAIYAKYAASKLKTSATTSFLTYDGAGTVTSETYDGSQATYQAVALSYDLTAAKLYYGAESMSMNDAGDAAESKYTYGLTVPFGAVTVGWGHSNAVFTSDAGTTKTTISGDKLFAKYALSKRTVAYVTTGKSTTSGAKGALTNSSIGLFHSF